MKIAHIITRLVAGGAQKNTLICAQHQQQQGHQVTVLSGPETGSEGSLLEAAAAANYRLILVEPMVRRIHPYLDAQALWQLIRLFRRERFDLIHTHTSKAGILGRLAAAVCGTPAVVHTPHGHVFHSYFSDFKSRLFQGVERAIAPLADVQVMLSHEELRDHLKAGVFGPERAVVIPSGVDLQPFRALDCQATQFTVGYVGRLADIKGPLDLVEAFALVAEKIPARLLLVGDGPQRELVVQRISALRLGERIQLVGWQNDVRPYLEQMSFLTVPSHNEGMGRVVVEAMAAGLPVLATRVGGLLDLVQPGLNGLLVEPKSPQALADAILGLYENRANLKVMGEAGSRGAQAFSQEVMLSRLDILYDRLARLKGIERSQG